MFAYCNNNPCNYFDADGREFVSISVVVGTIVVFCLFIPLMDWTARDFADFLQELSSKWQYAQIKISLFDEDENETDIPDVTYPGNDPKEAPEGTEWKGKGEKGSKEGNYYNKDTGESWHPDLDHPDPIGPHWDYNFKGSGTDGWRIFSNGDIIAKTIIAWFVTLWESIKEE